MLAPMALNTTAASWTLGDLWADPEWSKRFEAAAHRIPVPVTAGLVGVIERRSRAL